MTDEAYTPLFNSPYLVSILFLFDILMEGCSLRSSTFFGAKFSEFLALGTKCQLFFSNFQIIHETNEKLNDVWIVVTFVYRGCPEWGRSPGVQCLLLPGPEYPPSPLSTTSNGQDPAHLLRTQSLGWLRQEPRRLHPGPARGGDLPVHRTAGVHDQLADRKRREDDPEMPGIQHLRTGALRMHPRYKAWQKHKRFMHRQAKTEWNRQPFFCKFVQGNLFFFKS